MRSSHPGHRQWYPRSERTKGLAPSGSVSTALTSILSASPALGPEPAVYATIPPSWQSTGGERHALPVPGLDPGDVRQPLLIRPFGREIAVGEVAGSRQRLLPVRQAPQAGARVFFCEPPPPPASPRSPVPAPRSAGAGPRRRRCPDPAASPACRADRRSCFWAATRPYRPHDTS